MATVAGLGERVQNRWGIGGGLEADGTAGGVVVVCG